MSFASPVALPVLFGATASGKTDIACELFAANTDMVCPGSYTSRFTGSVEIVSADSVQMYKGLTVGSAAPSGAVRAVLPHHLTGSIEPFQEYSVAMFITDADRLCADIMQRGKLPVMLGGTAFYIKHFMYGLPETPPSDPKVRVFLQDKIKKEGNAAMLEALRVFDLRSACRIHVNDAYRIVRAHEVYMASGKPLSSFVLPTDFRGGYRFCPIFINRTRKDLYRRIEIRTEQMFAGGLQAEVQGLYNIGCRRDTPAMKAIGYREFFSFHGLQPAQIPVDAVKELIIHNTKQYAKRQQTFFKTFPNTYVVDASTENPAHQIHDILCKFYKNC